MNVNVLIGKRCLIKESTRGWNTTSIQEVKILEVSPSGNYVKLMNIHGTKYWRITTDLALVEQLVELEPHPNKKALESDDASA